MKVIPQISSLIGFTTLLNATDMEFENSVTGCMVINQNQQAFNYQTITINSQNPLKNILHKIATEVIEKRPDVLFYQGITNFDQHDSVDYLLDKLGYLSWIIPSSTQPLPTIPVLSYNPGRFNGLGTMKIHDKSPQTSTMIMNLFFV